jgi:hypothetical protein
MILAAQIVDTKDSVLIRSYAIPFAADRGGEGEHGQKFQRQSAAARSDCDKFTLWVRVFGPEIFAGSAVAVPATNRTDCYWKFDFQVRTTPIAEDRHSESITMQIGVSMAWLVQDALRRFGSP